MASLTPSQKRTGVAAALVVAFAAPYEAVKTVAYYDPPGILTVCEGHTGRDVRADKVYTLGECHTLAVADATKAVETVDRCAPGAPDSVRIAFADAVFNIGATVACDRARSTAARLLFARNWRGACDQLPNWNKAHVGGMLVELRGLTRRRIAERELCLKDAQ